MFSCLQQTTRTFLSQNSRYAFRGITAIPASSRSVSRPSIWSANPGQPQPNTEDMLSSPTQSVLEQKLKEGGSLWSFLQIELNKYIAKKEGNWVGKDPETIWKEREKFVESLRPPPSAYNGRSIPVSRDLAGAYASLTTVLRRNMVPYELRLNDRHEKKGVKRRRLSSERWRRRFAHEVRKKVQLVNEIRARGA